MKKVIERRTGPRTNLEEYYSVEFSLGNNHLIHQFKILNISKQGMGITVKKGSDVLKRLHAGQRVKMRFYKNRLSDQGKKIFSLPATEQFTTEIIHITEHKKGNYLVGLRIINKV